MAISTNGLQLVRLAGAVCNQQLSASDYSEILAANKTAAELDAWANAAVAAEFRNKTTTDIAKAVLANVGLSTVAGLEAWVAGQLTSAGAGNKGAKIISMLNDFSNISSTDATYGAAVTAFNTKVDAAQVLSQTTGNTGTTFAAAGTTTSALTFTLTTGVDSPSSTSGNDSYNAPAGTFTSLDAINGGAGTDTLNWVTTGAGVTAGPASARLTGIETINYTLTMLTH